MTYRTTKYSKFNYGKSWFNLSRELWNGLYYQNRFSTFRIQTATVLIYYYWEASLVSYLAFETFNLPFTNIETLLVNTDYQIAIYPGSNMEDIFKYSPDPVYQEAWEKRIQPYLIDYVPYTDNWIDVLNHKPKIALYNVGDATK